MERINRVHGGNLKAFAGFMGVKPNEVVDFSASINPLGPPSLLKKTLKEGFLKAQSRYPEPDAKGLKIALSEYHDIRPTHILPGNGSTHLIYLSVRAIKPKRALIIEPAFSEYRNALILSGGSVDSFILSEEDGFSLNIERLLPCLSKDYEMVFIANPSNPRGELILLNFIREIADFTEKRGIWLCLDEAFMDFCEVASFKKEAIKSKRVIILRSMTKFFSLAGLRLGYIIANEEVVKMLDRFIEPWSVNAIAQLAGVTALKDREFVDRTHLWLKTEKEYFLNGLKVIKDLRAYPSSANFLLIKILKEGISSPELQRKLFLKGILIRDCSSFIGLGEKFFRVAILRREENKRLVMCLREVFSGCY